MLFIFFISLQLGMPMSHETVFKSLRVSSPTDPFCRAQTEPFVHSKSRTAQPRFIYLPEVPLPCFSACCTPFSHTCHWVVFHTSYSSQNQEVASSYRLVGLVVTASALTAEDHGFESRLRRGFSGVESYQ